MTDTPSPSSGADFSDFVNEVNKKLSARPDKEWNYSRITLTIHPLENIPGPYVLLVEVIRVDSTDGKRELRAVENEVKWGERHNAELGILEIVSLRLNKALLDHPDPDRRQPVVRVVRKEDVAEKGITNALWYEVQEVSGEEFDSR